MQVEVKRRPAAIYCFHCNSPPERKPRKGSGRCPSCGDLVCEDCRRYRCPKEDGYWQSVRTMDMVATVTDMMKHCVTSWRDGLLVPTCGLPSSPD